MKTDLEHGFDELLRDDDRQRRGYQFQKWLHDVLLRAGFEVHANPRTAKPRQTDIYARRSSCDYLIEAKFRKAPVDVSDIDALRSRLGRTPGDVVGCLFSLSDYRSTAINAVADNRTREILLFNAAEIQYLARSPATLPRLVEEKRVSLRVQARVKFVSKDEDDTFPSEIRLPSSELQFWSGGRATGCIASAANNFDIVFSQHYLDPVGIRTIPSSPCGSTLMCATSPNFGKSPAPSTIILPFPLPEPLQFTKPRSAGMAQGPKAFSIAPPRGNPATRRLSPNYFITRRS
jgi:hypothetical protein